MSWFKRIFGSDSKEPKSGSGTPSSISLAETDWLEVASLFTKPTKPSLHAKPGWDEIWRAKIGASVPQVVEGLCGAGILRKANSTEMLEAEFSLSKLKEMAKARGLKVTGTKAILAQRLAEAGFDRAGVKKREVPYICTDYARPLVKDYKDKKLQARDDAQRTTLHLLKNKKWKEACELAANFEHAQYFQRGMNVDWSREAPKLLQVVRQVMKANPAYLVERFQRVPDEARILASMTRLWGVNNFSHLRAELVPHGMTEKDLFLCSNALRSHHPTGKAASEIKSMGLDILWECVAKDAPETCEVCKNADGKTYKPGEEPELPHVRCKCEMGCLCLYVHKVMDD